MSSSRGKGGEAKTSLVATWMVKLALKGWRGAQAVYGWSFYSQGTSDQTSASAETFVVAALKSFGNGMKPEFPGPATCRNGE